MSTTTNVYEENKKLLCGYPLLSGALVAVFGYYAIYKMIDTNYHKLYFKVCEGRVTTDFVY